MSSLARTTVSAPSGEAGSFAPGLTILMAAACGVIAAGSYLGQPLLRDIAQQLGMAPGLAGLIVTVCQIGYCLGLLVLAPLGDVVENRRLLAGTLTASAASLLLAAAAPTGSVFLFACFGIGVSSAAVQMLVGFATFIGPADRRGAVVGTVTSGLLIGILVAWPVASLVGGLIGWRVLFAADGAIVATLAVLFPRVLPARIPGTAHRYTALIASLWTLLRTTPELRRRAVMQAFLFAGFSLFWTTAPLLLIQRFSVGPVGSALFGLAGVGGALAAPLAGRLADHGFARQASLAGILLVGTGFVLAFLAGSIWLLGCAAIAIDAGVQTCHVIAQRAVLSIRPNAASRLNSLYIAIFFGGGAGGSAIAAPLFLSSPSAPAIAGIILAGFALLVWAYPPSTP